MRSHVFTLEQPTAALRVLLLNDETVLPSSEMEMLDYCYLELNPGRLERWLSN